MQWDTHSYIRDCLIILLRPIARFCIQRGVHFSDFLEVAKLSFVKAAEQELKDGISVSKLSVMTGLQRPEVNRLIKIGTRRESKDKIVRVLGQWVSDKSYTDSQGMPKPLSISGSKNNFQKLVFKVSKDLNYHTVRFELERLGLVSCKGGYLTLLQPAFIASGDPVQILKMAAEDAEDLLVACQENAFSASHIPNLHARTEYDNVPDEFIHRIREWMLELGQKIHEESRKYISRYDKDINPKIKSKEGSNRVVLGTYSRIEIN